jgi:translation initiation factor IF-1
VAPVEVEGVVEAQLPAALYTVRLDGSERRVTAHLGGGPDRNFIRLLPGDRVRLRLASQDLTRGAIVAKVR